MNGLSPQIAADGAQCFDADTALTPNSAAAIAALGFRCAIRYVSRGAGNASGDISTFEVDAVAAAGMALMLVQHCPPSRWTPTAALGTSYGANAAANAQAVCYPSSATLWLDLENMRPGCGVPAICTYVNAWARAVEAAGFEPGLYYSADAPLTPEQLYLDLVVRRYWRGLSQDAPTVAVRGSCVQQFFQEGTVAGIDVDRDVVMSDSFGGLPTWAVRAR